jgi:hypothetical protein
MEIPPPPSKSRYSLIHFGGNAENRKRNRVKICERAEVEKQKKEKQENICSKGEIDTKGKGKYE